MDESAHFGVLSDDITSYAVLKWSLDVVSRRPETRWRVYRSIFGFLTIDQKRGTNTGYNNSGIRMTSYECWEPDNHCGGGGGNDHDDVCHTSSEVRQSYS
ncbi:MAG: hypothetical protein H6Q48_1378 [Deltaproteobacteria bacterium]|nr:hypothetical protein [Deltaproteobacteria bacterium]